MIDLQRFKQQGFALARSCGAHRDYRAYCRQTGTPFVGVSAARNNKEFRVGIQLFHGVRFTEEGRDLLMAALHKGSTRHRRPGVGACDASANILPDKLQTVLEDVMALMADDRALDRNSRRAVEVPVVDSELKAA